jgi:hypothetical protein
MNVVEAFEQQPRIAAMERDVIDGAALVEYFAAIDRVRQTIP